MDGFPVSVRITEGDEGAGPDGGEFEEFEGFVEEERVRSAGGSRVRVRC